MSLQVLYRSVVRNYVTEATSDLVRLFQVDRYRQCQVFALGVDRFAQNLRAFMTSVVSNQDTNSILRETPGDGFAYPAACASDESGGLITQLSTPP